MNSRLLLLASLVLLSACALATPVVTPLGPAPTPTVTPTPVSTAVPWLKRPPVPISLPADEAPHDVLTEWWYYTGHLDATDGHRYGFELVVFQVRLGDLSPTYLSHFAITDLNRRQFHYDERAQTGLQPQPAGGGFSLTVADWQLGGRDGQDRLKATMANYAIDLSLSARKPPAKHLGEGFITLGPAGDSYYYSRTRMAVTGTLTDNGVVRSVTGDAWFDHQWGDFISVGGGSWDWYSLQLDDQSEVMLFVVRDLNAQPVIVYGSLVDAAGVTSDLPATSMQIEATGQWTSPRSGATYPSGWTIRLPRQALELTVTPTLVDQELITDRTTGVTYWEGSVTVTGTRQNQPITGRGYVELTGYAP